MTFSPWFAAFVQEAQVEPSLEVEIMQVVVGRSLRQVILNYTKWLGGDFSSKWRNSSML